MSAPTPAATRWYVYRDYSRPARFGESRGQIVWCVSRIVHGRGSRGLRLGAPTVFKSRISALNYAHREAARSAGRRRKVTT